MKVLVSGGGTGGHIYPALALIRHLEREENAEFLYIGTEKGLEASIVPKAGVPFKSVHITGFRRKISFENVKTIARFVKATRTAKKYISDFNPDVVIGTGGYVCGPVVFAAARAGIPTIVHEQNSVPGLTNKFLSKYVDKVAVSFEEAAQYFPKDKVVFTGNPRASEVAEHKSDHSSLAALGLSENKPTVLIVGGSRGAKPINEAVMAAFQDWKEESFQVVYVTGEVHYEEIADKMAGVSSNNIKTVSYIDDMPALLKEVHLVIARAGATTLAEITALGLPSILVPSPHVTNNHQFKNASALVDKGAAILLEENELTAELLTASIRSGLDKNNQIKMKEKAFEAGVPEAAALLSREMKALKKG
ncbi:undecaprenyldiphospho-muramoylpentapeptide beta-N-acetylglucosaminyltransferase [Alkalicoccus halolimnae]|uniref:UDP-N-acetylglucosamine--N-acetylmuramyl-(pentapeptide) pyrophosphoryl-undecaprenol N-acetylglucosamine transferase n=1 Tax=Alkalicoccus halolimnae TaxID=1667239 RepID=A0A5C7FN54_9BACI|nr:undecaprenyldiphospho-muramoylpentapeptide beta-N-acetylglucosaminyltransferase [Alkalicoccus halolimnae]TXF87429.1 undecaprenyldiphospho-muramoylpentapeptide beta-N-acetylglucosaminyltransferase [Alkalicoccus halolimnae]